ncbi:MAG: CPBP family intramembrane metalloprotease [Xanthomonadales bacterium]|nr:CPBP family intramembrane metalloprotease [Xanthomonadales bacterium]
MLTLSDGKITFVRLVFGYLIGSLISLTLYFTFFEDSQYSLAYTHLVKFSFLLFWFTVCFYPNKLWYKTVFKVENKLPPLYLLVSCLIVGAILFRVGYENLLYNYKFYFTPETLSHIAGSTKSMRLGLGDILGSVIMAPIVEEFFFRGVLLYYLCNKMQKKYAIICSAILFALPHMTLFMVIPGILLASVYLRYGIFASILVHALGNLTLFIIYISTSTSRLDYLNVIDSIWAEILGAIVFVITLFFLYTLIPKRMFSNRSRNV